MHSHRRRYAVLATVFALFMALFALAWLQYRWIGEAGRAELERTKNSLRRSAEQMAAEFDAELARLYIGVLAPGEGPEPDHRQYAERLRNWIAVSPHPNLLRSVMITEGGPGGIDELYRLDPVTQDIQRIAWPAGLAQLRAALILRGRPGAQRPRPGPPGMLEDLPVVVAPRGVAREFARAPRPDRDPGPPSRRPGEPPRPPQRYDDPLPEDREPPPDRDRPPRPSGWAIVWIDVDYFKSQWGPELHRKYFPGTEEAVYDVRIVSRISGRVIFDSNPAAAGMEFRNPDVEAGMFEVRPLAGIRAPGNPLRAGPGAAGPGPLRWTILVRHRAGSVESMVARNRNRNLAVSAGVLLIMAVAATVLMMSMRRSDRLARQQMQFVASVSHELRTPLAVIRSAAENLADGIVKGEAPVREYGAVILDQGRRLSYMVEQTLRFAGIQTGRGRYNLIPASVSAVVEDAMQSCGGVLRDSGCVLECRVDPALPAVMADPGSLSVCVSNLLTNAAKHAREGKWIGVAASLDSTGRVPRVRIQVSDRGPGIQPRDLPHIFEPFYRGRETEAKQIAGTGLGLALVRRIVSDHHGEVTVDTNSGEGTRFIVSLPVAPAHQVEEQRV